MDAIKKLFVLLDGFTGEREGGMRLRERGRV
jgi:hypothetical protein